MFKTYYAYGSPVQVASKMTDESEIRKTFSISR